MAGTAYPGVSNPAALAMQASVAIPYSTSTLGQAAGLMSFRQWSAAGKPYPVAAPGDPLLPGSPVVDTHTDGVASTEVAVPGSTAETLGAGTEWYEDLHILPHVKIEFGNIITQEEEEYEVYNAYRETDLTVNVIDDTAVTPGILLPNATPPIVVEAQTSMLDPTTTGNGGGIGLGTIVKLKIQAEANGLPIFDGDIVFSTAAGEEVSLGVSGQRIVLIPMKYESPTTEVLSFLTDVIESLNGKEQRLSLRRNPRQRFRVEYALDENDRQRMQALLLDWMDSTFGFPLWHEQLRTTAAVSAGATVYQVNTTAETDFRVGGLAIVFTDANTFDVINITAISGTTITGSDPSLNAYPAGTVIMPLRTARIVSAVNGRRFIRKLETFLVEFEVTDNDTGALTGSTTGWSAYNSRVLLDDCNVVDGQAIGESFSRRLYVLDNQTGKVDVRSAWDRYKRVHPKGFTARTRAQILKLRRLLLSLRGKQKAFYIPTFFDDLEVVANLTLGTSTIDINNIEYERHVQARDPQRIFRIEFTDGTNLIRVVQSASKISSTVERLTLDTTWPANRTIAEVSRIMFYELVRFDTDDFLITYPRVGLAQVEAPVRAVFDDN